MTTIAIEKFAAKSPPQESEFFSPTANPAVDSATDWETFAACRSVPNAIDLFFSEELAEIAAAKRVCAECPVIVQCLEAAISRNEPCGVWGGQLFLKGKILAQKRKRGRPPKNPRAKDAVPQLPVPARFQQLIA